MRQVRCDQDKLADRVAALTVIILTVIGNRYRTEIRPSIVTVRTSKFEVALIKSSNVTSPSRGRRLRVAIESPRRTFTSMPSIIFALRTLLPKVTGTTPPTQPRRPISKRRWRRETGPRSLVRCTFHQAISSPIRSDLSFGADALPKDLAFASLSETRIARLACANCSPDT